MSLTIHERKVRKPDIAGSRFGAIPGIPVGTRWADRRSMSLDHVHPPTMAGICGSKIDGARSVVLAGEYDDEDHGETFIYIGSGGREPGIRTGPQTAHQSFENNLNHALKISAKTGRPVRVIRGARLTSKYAPYTGFRYDGLYTVHNPRIEQARNGYNVCKFDFVRIPGQEPIPEEAGLPPLEGDIAIRRAMFRARGKRDQPYASTSTLVQPVSAKWEGAGQPKASTSAIQLQQNNPRPTAGPSEPRGTSVESDVQSSASPRSPLSRSMSPTTITHTTEGWEDEEAYDLEELGLDESDDEDQEDLFADIDRVEREFAPVRSVINQISQQDTTEEGKKAKGRLLVQLGNHISGILKRKQQLKDDRFDYDWWRHELWSYVAALLPSPDERMMSAEGVERAYNKRKGRQTVRHKRLAAVKRGK